METQKPIVKVIETREVSYKKKSYLFGLIEWYTRANTEFVANDVVLILRTPIRKIHIDNYGEIKEIDLSIREVKD